MKILMLVLSLLTICPIYGESYPQWNWALATGSGGIELLGSVIHTRPSIAISNTGRKYIAGSFTGMMACGSTYLNSIGEEDIFVAKLNASGDYIWARSAGAYGMDICTDIKVDGMGNVYITGYDESGQFGSINLYDHGMYIAKLDTDGNWLWVRETVSYGQSCGYSLALDNNGNCFVTGNFWGSVYFGSNHLTSIEDSEDIFVVKMDYNGTWLWAKRAGLGQDDFGSGICTDGNGNSYVTGYISRFEDPNDPYYNLFPDFQAQLYIAKLNATGDWQWQREYGGDRICEAGWDVTVDATGNSYVAGAFGIQGGPLYGTVIVEPLICQGQRDGFVAKFNSGGEGVWSTRCGGSGDDILSSITIDTTNHLYVTGGLSPGAMVGNHAPYISTNGSLFVARLNSDGYWNWAVTPNGGFSEGYCVYVNSTQILGVAGVFHDSIGFGSTILTYNSTSGLTNDICFATLSTAQTILTPKAPENVSISKEGIDLVISWNPVTETTQNTPMVTDYYTIYSTFDNYINGPYQILDSVEQTSYTVYNAFTLPRKMFFFIRAINE
jgi:hypothetical protein